MVRLELTATCGYRAGVSAPFLDSKLHDLVVPAVVAAASRAHLYVATGTRPPLDVVPETGVFDSGWPTVHERDHIRALELEEPWRYERMTFLSGFNSSPIDAEWGVAVAREVVELVDYVNSVDGLVERLVPRHVLDHSSRGIASSVTWWILKILERAWNLGLVPRADGDSEEWRSRPPRRDEAPQLVEEFASTISAGLDHAGLDAIYREAETALLSPTLPVEYWIPLVLTPLPAGAAVKLDSQCRVEPFDAQQQVARFLAGRNVLAGSPSVVREAATHALVVAGDPLQNPGPGPRLLQHPVIDPVDYAVIDTACEALRITTGANVGYAEVLVKPLGWADYWNADLPTFQLHDSRRRYNPDLDQYGWLTSKPATVTQEKLSNAPAVLAGLKSAHPRAKLASRRLSMSVLREDEDDQIVDLCIGLEALLSDGATTELTFKMSLRGAAALATRAKDPLSAENVKNLLTKVYKHRSAVVHGNPNLADTRHIKKKDAHGKILDSTPVAGVAEQLLRYLLIDALERGWTAETLDAAILAILSPAAANN